jgi:hypothetical protein
MDVVIGGAHGRLQEGEPSTLPLLGGRTASQYVWEILVSWRRLTAKVVPSTCHSVCPLLFLVGSGCPGGA